MRAKYGVPARGLLSAFVALLAVASAASADTSSERPGSILIFPKVVVSATRDTVIQIANTGNMVNELRCFYLDGSSCVVNDFELSLTKQQPTHWRASSGRRVNPLDNFGSDGSGLDPGVIPGVGPDFAGALVCVETTDGEPVTQNKLKGEASLQDLSGSPNANDSKYNAVAVSGGTGPTDNDGDNDLELNGTEYSACSTLHRLDAITEAADGDPVLGSDSQVITNITVVPCDLDFRRGRPTTVVLNQNAWNEMENLGSGPDRTFSCWDSFTLDTTSLNPQTTFASIEISSSSPVLMVAESFHTDSSGAPLTASAARNVHAVPGDTSSVIRLSPK